MTLPLHDALSDTPDWWLKVNAVNRQIQRSLPTFLKNIETLSERRMTTLKLLASGLCNKKIAQAMSISESTVKAHVTELFRQLGINTRTEAALLTFMYYTANEELRRPTETPALPTRPRAELPFARLAGASPAYAG